MVRFEQYQYGGNGADGIGFYLVDGSTDLTSAGADGGSLGDARRNLAPGLDGGYLGIGIGLDAYGDFAGPHPRRPSLGRPSSPCGDRADTGRAAGARRCRDAGGAVALGRAQAAWGAAEALRSSSLGGDRRTPVRGSAVTGPRAGSPG